MSKAQAKRAESIERRLERLERKQAVTTRHTEGTCDPRELPIPDEDPAKGGQLPLNYKERGVQQFLDSVKR